MRLPLSFLLLIPVSLAIQCLTGSFDINADAVYKNTACESSTCLTHLVKSSNRLILSCGTENRCKEEGCHPTPEGDLTCCCSTMSCNAEVNPELGKVMKAYKKKKPDVSHEELPKPSHKEEATKPEEVNRFEIPEVPEPEEVPDESEDNKKEPDYLFEIPSIPEPRYVPEPHEERKHNHGPTKPGPSTEGPSTTKESVMKTCTFGVAGKDPMDRNTFNKGDSVRCSTQCMRTVFKMHGIIRDWTFGCAPNEDSCSGLMKCNSTLLADVMKQRQSCCCTDDMCNDIVREAKKPGNGGEGGRKKDPALEKKRREFRELVLAFKKTLQELPEKKVVKVVGQMLNERQKEALDFGLEVQNLADSTASQNGIHDGHEVKNFLTKEGRKEVQRELFEEYLRKRKEHNEITHWVDADKFHLVEDLEEVKKRQRERKIEREKEEADGFAAKFGEYVDGLKSEAASWFSIPKWFKKD